MNNPFARWPDRLEFQLGWAILGTLIGLGYAINGVTPAIAQLLHPWLLPSWIASLLASGVAEFAGALVSATTLDPNRRKWALLVERAAVALQAGSVFTIGVASVYVWELTRHTDHPNPFPVIGVSLITVWIAINIVRDRRIASRYKPRATTPLAEPAKE